MISFDQQLINHNKTISRVTAALSGDKKKAADHLNKCIYIAGFGSNDYINNYLMPNLYPNSKIPPDQYAQKLINKYTQQLSVSISIFICTNIKIHNLTLLFSFYLNADSIQLWSKEDCNLRTWTYRLHSSRGFIE